MEPAIARDRVALRQFSRSIPICLLNAVDMSDPKKSKNFVVANGPVNRRTAPPPNPAKAPVAAVVRARIQQAQTRRLLGTPLSLRLGSAHSDTGHQHRLTPVAILQVVGGTIGACGLVLGVLQSAWTVGAGGIAVMAGFALWALTSRRFRPDDAKASGAEFADLVDAGDLQRLDSAMESVAAQLPQSAIDQLTGLKESIAHCVAMMAQMPSSGGFVGEDQLYVREAVRRYIPDTLTAYLNVPQKDRANLVIDGSKPALNLLQDQLAMIQQQIEASETRLVQGAGEALMRQQRFLAAKSNQRQ